MEKVLVAPPKEVVAIVDQEIVGKLGLKRSEAYRMMIMGWLTEQGYLAAKGGKIAKGQS